MAPLVGAFKLFGKVITPPVPAVAGEEEPQRLPGDGERDRTAAIKREAPAGDLEGEETKQQGQGGGAAPRTQLQESAEARAAAAPLPCPRCRSRDTKFCYFNNYNVNQPRHFCKACHRYWTAGGALRNVPVGAGRRKNRPVLPHADYQVRLAPGPASASASVEAPDMAPALGFIPAPEHGWSSLYVVPSPSPAAAAYRGHGAEMEQCWWLVHAERPPLGSSDPAF